MTESQLMQDIKATFPGFHVEIDYPFSNELVGIAIKADTSVLMPDGMPVFDDYGPEHSYDDGVHSGFSAWLDRRGYYVEPYGHGCWCAIPLPTDAQVSHWRVEHRLSGSAVLDDCPF